MFPGQRRLLLVTRILLIVGGVVWCFAPTRPRATAQIYTPTLEGLTERVAAENQHINSVDERFDRSLTEEGSYRAAVTASLSRLESDAAGRQGEERIIGFVVGLISTVSVVIQVRKKGEK